MRSEIFKPSDPHYAGIAQARSQACCAPGGVRGRGEGGHPGREREVLKNRKKEWWGVGKVATAGALPCEDLPGLNQWRGCPWSSTEAGVSATLMGHKCKFRERHLCSGFECSVPMAVVKDLVERHLEG